MVHREAFTYMGDQKQFVEIDQNDLYPYLLVNIGSGVGMIKVVIIGYVLALFVQLPNILTFLRTEINGWIITYRWKEMESLSELVEQV